MSASIPAIGIDLGTTYCCAGVFHNGKVEIIPNQEDGGDYITPSYAFIDFDGEEVVGKQAKQNAFRNPENTIYDVKRIIGRKITDKDLQRDMQFWPFKVEADVDGIPKVKVNGKLWYPEEISAKLLTKLRTSADDFLGFQHGTVKKAVITVPAYFNDGQRQATVDAGTLAGLEVLTILNEPTAAAIAYSVQKKPDTNPKKVLVFDLGGGTFDVAVLSMHQNKIDVLGVNGDTHLGGEDFDRNLMEYAAAKFKAETKLDLLKGKESTDHRVREKTKRNLGRLQAACENAKQYLTAGNRSNVTVDAILNGRDLIVEVTRDKFEGLNISLFQRTIDLVDITLKELNLSKHDIDDVVLVGGSTRIPKIQEMLTKYFDGKILNKSVHPDQAVAYGAAVTAAMMTGEHSIGQVELTSQIEDVTPMSIGVMNAKMGLSVIIPKNTKIPTKMEREVITFQDEQTTMLLQIYQGDDLKIASNNKLLGHFTLDGIPPNKAREEKAIVSMEIDAMGILHVEAVCKSTRGKQILTVKENKDRLGKELIQKLISKGINV